jgi:hypothetical protein
MKNYRSGLWIARRLDLPPLATRLALGMAKCCRRGRQIDRAMEYLEEVQETVDVNRTPYRGDVWVEFGHLATIGERYSEAIEYFQSARSFFEAQGSQAQSRICSRLLAGVFLAQEETSAALDAGVAALDDGDLHHLWVAALSRLDPRMSTAATPGFLSGDYEAALHMAFRACEMELAQRAALGGRDDLSPMVERWFTEGMRGLAPWIDEKELKGFGNLWKGAFAARRNPQAHRSLPMTSTEAFTWLTLAHLMLSLLDQPEGNDRQI